MDVGPKLASSLNSSGLPSYQSYLSLSINHTFSFTPITTADLNVIIKRFDPKPTIGHDVISMKIVKLLEQNFTDALTLIINQSLNSGVFLDSLKIAKILPIYKKVMILSLTIIDPFPYCLQFPNCLNELYMINYIPISLLTNYYTLVNMDSGNYILQKRHHLSLLIKLCSTLIMANLP